MEPETSDQWYSYSRGVMLSSYERVHVAETWGEACSLGLRETKERLGEVLLTLQKLFTGQIKVTNLGGPITILPLAFFTAGTRMLPMTTVGILFYVTPSLQFLSGILLLGEALSTNKLIAFAGIWTGLAIFTYSLLTSKSETG